MTYTKRYSQNRWGDVFEGHLADRKVQQTQEGAYILRHNASGKFYIGHTMDMYARMAAHVYTLRQGRHVSAPLQAVYNEDPHFTVEFLPAEYRTDRWRRKEDASNKAKVLLSQYKDDPLLINPERAKTKRNLDIATDRRRTRVVINGVQYRSMRIAADFFRVTARTVKERCSSADWEHWQYYQPPNQEEPSDGVDTRESTDPGVVHL